MSTAGKTRIMIFGPKDDGTYVVEFRTAEGEVLAISIPRSEATVIRYFQGADALRAVRAGGADQLEPPNPWNQSSGSQLWSLPGPLPGRTSWPGSSKNCCCLPAWAGSSPASRTP
jgi:hypothetical protein